MRSAKPACFKMPFAVWRERILWSTGKIVAVIGLCPQLAVAFPGAHELAAVLLEKSLEFPS